jgi:hypothetical protein
MKEINMGQRKEEKNMETKAESTYGKEAFTFVYYVTTLSFSQTKRHRLVG